MFKTRLVGLAAATLFASCGAVLAAPTITAIGGASPASITNRIAGTVFVGGSLNGNVTRFALNANNLTWIEAVGITGTGALSADARYATTSIVNTPRFASANSATGVSPAFNPNPTLTVSTTQPGAAEFGGGRWDFNTSTQANLGTLPIIPYTPPVPGLAGQGTSGIYGTSSSGGTSGNFVSPNAISADGRFISALAYACVFNTGSTAGTQIVANSFYWRPALWDSQTGALEVLPTPFRSSQSANGGNNRRRTGNPYAISSDGNVVVGATEHNVSTQPGPDVDGARLVVWRRTAGVWTMSYLDTGLDANNFPNYVGSTPSGVTMNAAGTIIAARGANGQLTKWVWDGVNSTWGAPILLGSNLSTPASWLPNSVTSCGVPPTLGNVIAMSEDGSIIVGSAAYSTCGSFMNGGFIWHESDGLIKDWYDYNVALGTPAVGPGQLYGPIGDNGDPTRGLPALGSPVKISPDGTLIAGTVLGPQFIVGSLPYIWESTGTAPCVDVKVVRNPNPVVNFSACSSSIVVSVSAGGTGPFTYQWFKDGNPIADGLQPQGSTVTGATTYLLSIAPPLTPADAGSYTCVITGQCGAPATSAAATVQIDPAFATPAVNDTCATAQTVTQGTNVLSPAQSPCSAFINDPLSGSSCVSNSKTDRWFRFVPVASGNYRIETCGANFDTVLSIFDACGGSELACNNDYLTGPSTGCTSSRSRISTIALTAGTPYLIRVAAPINAFLSGTSTINLSINPAPTIPSNDDCLDALQVGPGVHPFNTTEALPSPLAPLTCASTAHQSRDVWFRYTAPRQQRIDISTCPQGTAPVGYSLMNNTVLSIHDSACGGELLCNDNHTPAPAGCGTSLSTINGIQLGAGSTIYIRVSGNNSTTFGAGQLAIKTCFADITDIGDTGDGPDGQLTVDDVIAFVNTFGDSVGCPGTPGVQCNRSDVTDIGDTGAGPDGELTVDDIIAFVNAFGDGCPA
jgi:hypothetical protein